MHISLLQKIECADKAAVFIIRLINNPKNTVKGCHLRFLHIAESEYHPNLTFSLRVGFARFLNERLGMDESLSYLWIMEPYLVGIAGGTASGKSTLTHQLIRCAGEERAAVVELDAYYRPQDHLLFEERVLTNYDHPDTFEFSLLIQHLQVLKRGESVDSPVYDFAQHARRAGDVKQVAVRPVIFIEGFLVLANPEVCALLDLRIFVHAPDELRLSRRLLRDVNERGRTEQGVLQQWHSTVYPMHQQFCAPSKSAADIVIDGSAWTSLDVEQLWADVWARYLMKQRTLCSSAVEV